jgi:hypothetical protein
VKKRAIILVVAGLVAALVVLHWPRLDPQLSYVTRSECSGDQMVIEYRMSRPFEVLLGHEIRTPAPRHEEPGIYLDGGRTRRSARAGVFPSRYSWLRGEYYVLLRFRRGNSFTVEGNGTRAEIPPWTTGGAGKPKWLPPGAGLMLGDGNGIDIVEWNTSAEEQECLDARAQSTGAR